jgi:hypothetical protein
MSANTFRFLIYRFAPGRLRETINQKHRVSIPWRRHWTFVVSNFLSYTFSYFLGCPGPQQSFLFGPRRLVQHPAKENRMKKLLSLLAFSVVVCVTTAAPLPAQQAPLRTVDLPEGFRAVGIRVPPDTSLTTLFVLPGSRVDLVVTTRKSKNEVVSQILVENVLVLALDMPKRDSDLLRPAVVTLALSVKDAKRVVGAAQIGTISMLLRPVGKK